MQHTSAVLHEVQHCHTFLNTHLNCPVQHTVLHALHIVTMSHIGTALHSAGLSHVQHCHMCYTSVAHLHCTLLHAVQHCHINTHRHCTALCNIHLQCYVQSNIVTPSLTHVSTASDSAVSHCHIVNVVTLSHCHLCVMQELEYKHKLWQSNTYTT